MNVNAGALNQRIQIMRYTETANSAGYLAPPKDPEVVHACWAQFSRTSGTEAMKAGADFGEVKARFLIRYTRKVLDRKMFIRYRDRDYQIEYINDYGDAHEYIELMCKWSGTGGGA